MNTITETTHNEQPKKQPKEQQEQATKLERGHCDKECQQSSLGRKCEICCEFCCALCNPTYLVTPNKKLETETVFLCSECLNSCPICHACGIMIISYNSPECTKCKQDYCFECAGTELWCPRMSTRRYCKSPSCFVPEPQRYELKDLAVRNVGPGIGVTGPIGITGPTTPLPKPRYVFHTGDNVFSHYNFQWIHPYTREEQYVPNTKDNTRDDKRDNTRDNTREHVKETKKDLDEWWQQYQQRSNLKIRARQLLNSTDGLFELLKLDCNSELCEELLSIAETDQTSTIYLTQVIDKISKFLLASLNE